MPEFYIARKNKHKFPNFTWYMPEKLIKCLKFTWFLPEKYFSRFFFWGGGGKCASAPPVSYAYAVSWLSTGHVFGRLCEREQETTSTSQCWIDWAHHWNRKPMSTASTWWFRRWNARRWRRRWRHVPATSVSWRTVYPRRVRTSNNSCRSVNPIHTADADATQLSSW